MHVSRIDHIHIKVDELEKTTQEYEKVFGFSFPPVIEKLCFAKSRSTSFYISILNLLLPFVNQKCYYVL